jgi:uncharacterized protein (DUF1697 family)
MTRYVAFLRGVSPLNAKMPELKRCFELAGFSEVKTVLSSGNVVFDSRSTSLSAIQNKAETAMTNHLGRSFYTIVRPQKALEEILALDPFIDFDVASDAKRVVTFLREPHKPTKRLPIELDGAHILKMTGREVFTAYIPNPRGPVFMTLIEKTFGVDVTTRTWQTVQKCAKA